MFLKYNLIILKFDVLFLFKYMYLYIFIIIKILWINRNVKIIYNLKLNDILQQIDDNLNLNQISIIILMHIIENLHLLIILIIPLYYLKKDNQKV